MYSVGLCYERGDGVHKDRLKAVEWFQKASVKGHPGAQYKMGEYYESGLGGLTKSQVKAREFYEKAAGQGDEDAKKALERMDRGEAAPQTDGPEAAPAAPQAEAKEEPKPKKKGFFGRLFH